MANRHDVIIWDASEEDLSKDFNELLGSGGDYAEIEQSPSSNLLAFADALNQHSNRIDYNRSFFKQAAYVVKHATTKAVIIEIPEDEWQRPLRDIVQLAQNYNLIVADEEIAMAFLPTGKIRPYGAEDEWSALLGELAEADEVRLAYEETKLPTTVKAYATWVGDLLDKNLGQYGFKKVRAYKHDTNSSFHSVYCREVDTGQQYLDFTHVGQSPYFSTGTTFYMFCPMVKDIYNLFDFYKNINEVFRAALESFTDITGYTSSPLSEDLAQRHINDVINYIIKPIFDKTTDIKGLDNFMNGWLLKQPDEYMVLQNDINYLIANTKKIIHPDEFNNAGFDTPQRLIAARLANNPQYDRLLKFCEAYKSFGANDKARATEWPKLVKYLEEEINPETFWQQYTLLKEEEKRLEEDRIQQLITQFKLNPDEELIPVSDQWYDAKTNLIWQRYRMGQHWQNGQITGMAELMSWDEKEAYLERFKDTGWRLPQYQELITLSFPEYVGYITKNGYEFYEKIHTNFYDCWITPFFKMGSELTCVVSVSEGTSQYSKHKSEPDLKGYIRLVRWAC